MGANSKHYGDIYRWIEKIIESSDNIEQESSVLNLINLFDRNCQHSGAKLTVSEILKEEKHNNSIRKQMLELVKKSNNHFLKLKKKIIW